MLTRLRLISGLTLFVFALVHFLNISLGLVSVDLMDLTRPYMMGPWRSLPGAALLTVAALVHVAAGIVSIYQRRNLRLRSAYMVQVVLALLIPLLLVSHVLGTRMMYAVHDFETNYVIELLIYFVFLPDYGVRQVVLLLAVWIHSWIGITAWLRLKPWYAGARSYLNARFLLLPALVLASFLSTGMQVREKVKMPDWLNGLLAKVKFDESFVGWVLGWEFRMQVLILLIIAAVLAFRYLSQHRGRSAGHLTYQNEAPRQIRIQHGASVLDLIRQAGCAHAAACGGRGRCSTCRVRVTAVPGRTPCLAENSGTGRGPPGLPVAAGQRPGGGAADAGGRCHAACAGGSPPAAWPGSGDLRALRGHSWFHPDQRGPVALRHGVFYSTAISPPWAMRCSRPAAGSTSSSVTA